jgi:hypothetical protein
MTGLNAGRIGRIHATNAEVLAESAVK